MIRKLIKHEALRTGPKAGTILGIFTLVVLLCGVFARFNFPMISAFVGQVGTIAIVSAWPVINVLLAIDFWRTSWGRVGYLTHSLPVKGSTILWVRLLWGAACQVIAFAWTALALLGSMYLSNPSFQGGNLPINGTVLLLFVGALFIGWFWLVQFYFAVTIGNGPRLAALGAAGPIITWVVVSVVFAIVACIMILLVPLGLDLAGGDVSLQIVDIGTLAARYQAQSMVGGSNMTMNKNAAVMPFGWVFAPVALIVVCLPWMLRNWNRRISLR